MMNFSRIAAIVLRQFYWLRWEPFADTAALHVGDDRHDPVGIHYPLPEHRHPFGL